MVELLKYVGLLPALGGAFAETLGEWFGLNLPEKIEFVRGRGDSPHLRALLFCALAYIICSRWYVTLSQTQVDNRRALFGIAAGVLLLLSANFIYLDFLPPDWLSLTATQWRIGLTEWAYVLGYISLGATIADKQRP
jgi:hypothetical protein